MSFTDHKITAFTHKIADLPDEPQIPAAELKSRFDACPEELRQSLNAVCDDAARLEARVEGIVVDTFGDTIDKEMLSDELAAELDGKATKTELTGAVDTLEQADDALAQQIAQKCEVVIGSYVGNSASQQEIELGFAPLAVIVVSQRGSLYESRLGRGYGGFALPDSPAAMGSSKVVECTATGFKVFYDSADDIWSNASSEDYHYLAFRPVTA